MRIAFLLIVYKQPEQVIRLVRRLSCDESYFFIHVDKKEDISHYLTLKQLSNVQFFEPRQDIIWASYGFTELILNMTKLALSHSIKFDFIGTLSGQCYPIQPVNKIIQFLSENKDYSFIPVEDLDSPWYNVAKSRYTQFHLTNFRFKGKHRLQNLISYIMPTRRQTFFEQIYGSPRATWMILSREACNYVLDYTRNTKKLASFFKYTWGIDEILIPSILLNSNLKSKIKKYGLWYIDWSTKTANPKILTTNDYLKLRESDKLFARKFDNTVDQIVLDKIDNHLEKYS